jgi:hypothetical protein
MKVLMIPVPEKFNTFNTFNTFTTFDHVASGSLLPASSASANPNRRQYRSPGSPPALHSPLPIQLRGGYMLPSPGSTGEGLGVRAF